MARTLQLDTITAIDQVLLETETATISHLLFDQTDATGADKGSRVVQEENTFGSAFVKGETITGGTSGATAKVDSTDGQYITVEESDGTWQASETVTGGTSGTTGTMAPSDFYTKGDIENGYIPIGSGILGVTRLFNFGGAATNNTRDGQLFDLMYLELY